MKVPFLFYWTTSASKTHLATRVFCLTKHSQGTDGACGSAGWFFFSGRQILQLLTFVDFNPAEEHSMDLNESISGGAAGVAQNLVGFPLDLLKVKMQTSQSGASVGQVFRSVVATDGVFGLFRGIQSPMAGLVAMNALVFQSFGWAKQALGERQGVELSVQRLFVAGSIAGAAITIAEGPVDFLKTQLQLKRFPGFLDAAKTIWQKRGIAGYLQGFGASLARNIPANACWYGTFEWMRERMKSNPEMRRSEIGFFPTLVSGGIAGIAYWTSIYPIDVIKSTIQGDHWDPKQRVYKGISDTARQIYSKSGFGGFYKG